MRNIEEKRFFAEQYDSWVEQRVEFMYNYLDYNNDRYKIREKFAKEMNKKTSLKDIGEKLDEFIYTSKAKELDYWHDSKHLLEQPDMATKNLDSKEFDWKEKFKESFNPLKPHWIDEKSEIETLPTEDYQKMTEIFEEVEFRDEMRKQANEELTPEEQKEISLFHSYKQDPFFKHHLRTHLSKFAEDTSESTISSYH